VTHARAAPLADDPLEVARPFAWIAAVFFATGFLGYFAIFPL
jgi:hypothetical protein